MVSVLLKKLECSVEKLTYKAQEQALWSHAVEDQNQIRTSKWWTNRSSSVHTKFYSRN